MIKVDNAPSQAQKIDIEEWKQIRNKKMAIGKIQMVNEKGEKIEASSPSVELFEKQGYKVISPTVKEVKKILQPKAETPKVEKPKSQPTGNVRKPN